MVPLEGKKKIITFLTWRSKSHLERVLKFTLFLKKKQKHPAIYPQQPTSTEKLKLHSVQVNLLILATGKLAHKLNCNPEPKPRESRANSGSPSLG